MVSQNQRDAAYADGYNDGFRQGKQSRATASTVAPVEQSGIDNAIAVVGTLCNQWAQERKRRIELYQGVDLYYDGLTKAAELIMERLRQIQPDARAIPKLELPPSEYWNKFEHD